jgi:hypothetical protein
VSPATTHESLIEFISGFMRVVLVIGSCILARYVVLSQATAKLFSGAGKQRRPGSIYRPYLGDYLRKGDASAEDPKLRDVLDQVSVLVAGKRSSVLIGKREP